MLVTHTERQVVPLFPRLRIMAMSMERLQIGRARISAITMEMIHLNPVVMLEEQAAIATAPVLRFQQLGQFRTGVRMPSLSSTPVHPIPIVRAAVPSDLDMPRDRRPTMGQQMHGVGLSGRGGKGPPVVQWRPIPFPHPAGGFRWVPPVCPAAKLFPGEKVQPVAGGLTHAGAVIGCPASHCRVELLDQGPLW